MIILFYTIDSTYVGRRIGGAQTSIRLMGEALSARGHKIYYLTKGEKNQKHIICKSVNGVEVIFYPHFADRSPRYIIDKLLRGKKKARERRKGKFKEFVDQFVRSKNIEVVYTYYDLNGLSDLYEVAHSACIPFIMRMAGLKWYEESRYDQSKKKEYEAIFRSVDSINYNTPGLKALVYEKAKEINFDYAPKNEFIADIGAMPKEAFQSRNTARDDVLRIIVATRFSSYQKRHDILIEAIAGVKNKKNIQVTLVGSGPEELNIKNSIRKNNLEGVVQIIPFLKQKQLWSLMQDSDLLCHPCEYEGLSKIILESMMMGLPVLASNVSPLDDYIQHNETGYLVNNDAVDWSNMIELILENKAVLNTVADKAYLSTKSRYDVKVNAVEIEKQFLQVISSGECNLAG